MKELINRLKSIVGVGGEVDGCLAGKLGSNLPNPGPAPPILQFLSQQNCLARAPPPHPPLAPPPGYPLPPSHVLPADGERSAGPGRPPTSPATGSASGPKASSGAAAEEVSSKSSLEALWDALSSGSGPHSATTTPPHSLPERRHPLVSQIQFELQLLLDEFPAGTPPKALCQALAYVLYSKHGWQVKFCCKTNIPRQASCVPAAWMDEVVTVTTPDGLGCVVDIHFRDKFLMRCPAGVDEHKFASFLRLLPEVYVGLVDQLLLDVKSCTAALEKIRQGTLPPWCCSRTLRALYKLCAECDPTPSRDCLCAIEARLSCPGPVALEEEHVTFRDGVCCLDAAQLDRLAAVLTRSFSLCGGLPFSPSGLLPLEFEKEEPSGEEDLSATTPGGLSYLLAACR